MQQIETTTESLLRAPAPEIHANSNDSPSDIATIRAVLPFAEPFFCRANEDVLSHGSESRCFYYVERGTVEVSYSEQGTKILVSLIGAGNFFGEIGFF
ncbi:MAG: cyclic nucleotide-binding domain-containing protein, partial [Desulfobacterales bacterium]|nr:cyclic nucleotide-binding domain-containing protein [Desulfobacterales bacterium]